MKSTFKSFLAEGNMANAVASLDVSTFKLPELLACYRNAGYEVSRSEAKMFLDTFYDKYAKKGQHVFRVLMLNDNDPEDFEAYISSMYVTIGSDGKLVAEPGGTPDESGSLAEMKAAFAKMK